MTDFNLIPILVAVGVVIGFALAVMYEGESE